MTPQIIILQEKTKKNANYGLKGLQTSSGQGVLYNSSSIYSILLHIENVAEVANVYFGSCEVAVRSQKQRWNIPYIFIFQSGFARVPPAYGLKLAPPYKSWALCGSHRLHMPWPGPTRSVPGLCWTMGDESDVFINKDNEA